MRFACPTLRRWCWTLLVPAMCWHLSTAPLLAADGQDVLEAATWEVDRLIASVGRVQEIFG